MAKNRFYVVWSGRNPGIYSDWEVCKREIMGCKGAKYKGFPDRTSAEIAFREGPENYWGKDVAPVTDLSAAKERPVSPCIAVDAACSGNPGKMEYQGVFVDFATQPATRRDLFKSPVFPNATNNIGEFLALVHALALQKKCKTKLQPNAKNEQLFELVARAEKWLAENAIEVPILKWKTEIWGEIPADYGRK